MVTHQVAAQRWLALAMGLLWGVAAAGCTAVEPGCRTSDDCREGRVCVDRICLTPGELPDGWSGEVPGADVGFANHHSGDTEQGEDATTPGQDVVLLPDALGEDDAGTPGMDDTGPVEPGPGAPALRIFPATGYVFGQVSLGTTIHTDMVVDNVGDGVLTLRDVSLSVAQAYGLEPVIRPPASRELAPGERQRFEITFAPSLATQVQSSVELRSDAENAPEESLSLTGRGVNPATGACLNASPNGLNFGELEVGKDVELTVTVFNCSRLVPLQVLAIEISGTGTPAFELASEHGLPLSLLPGQGKALTVRFAPGATRNFRESLSIQADVTLNQLARVQLSGTGVAP